MDVELGKQAVSVPEIVGFEVMTTGSAAREARGTTEETAREVRRMHTNLAAKERKQHNTPTDWIEDARHGSPQIW